MCPEQNVGKTDTPPEAKFAETRRRLSWEFRFVLTITLHWPTFRSLSEFANPMSSPPRPGTSIFEIYAILTPKIGCSPFSYR